MKPESLTILGAGIIGLSLAREARLRGLRVKVYDSRPNGSSCTHSATGVLKAPEHRRSPYLDLRHRSWEEWPDFAESLKQESGGLDVGFRICGGLDLRDRTARDPQRAVEKLYGSGGAVRILEAEELATLLPAMKRVPQSAVFIEHQAVVDPSSLMSALEKSCTSLGVEIHYDQGEIQLQSTTDGLRLQTEAGDTIAQPSEMEPVVLSAGWETSALADHLRAEPLPLEPVRGEAISLDIPAPPHIVTFDARLKDVPDPAGNRSRFSWIPGPGGISWFGNSVGDTGSGKERSPQPTTTGRSRLLEAAESFFGAGISDRVIDHWAGLRPKSLRHGGPLLGSLDGDRRVWIATGHYRTGLLIGPLTARWVIADILGEGEIPEVFSVPQAGAD
ncbi:MAG: hypothetical protein CBC13_03895 [Planctomycetia bacterium TMED53]|nr:MAG: hypothetical protein CBC13_03895 [Planctomycetia bacterium TMED53]